MKIRLILAALVGLAGSVVYFLVASLAEGDRHLEGDTPATDESILAATTVAISAEAAGIVGDTIVLSAPQPPRATTTNREARESEPPAPPEGYSLVEIDDRTNQGRIDAPRDDPNDVRNDSLTWLGAPSSMETLVNQAASTGRGWSFGWIRLADGAMREDFERQIERLGGRVVGSAGHLVRAMLPGDIPRLEAIGRLDSVRGLGAVPPREKLPPVFPVKCKPSHCPSRYPYSSP